MERIRSLEELEKCMKEVKSDYAGPNENSKGEIFIHNMVIEINEDFNLIGEEDYLVIFSSCVFSNCRFDYKTIKNIRFMHCDFIDNFMFRVNINSCNFKYCNFDNNNLACAEIKSSEIELCNINNGTLNSINFYYCDIKTTHFGDCNMKNSTFDKCKIIYCNFSDNYSRKLNNFKMKKSRIKFCDLGNINDADIQDTIIEKSEMKFIYDCKEVESLSVPEEGAFLGYVIVRIWTKEKRFYAIAQALITENSKRESLDNGKYVRADQVKILDVYAVNKHGPVVRSKLKNPENSIIRLDNKERKIGDTINVKGFNSARRCGIYLWTTEQQAIDALRKW